VPLKIVSDQSLTNGQAARTVKRPAGQELRWQMGENAFLRLRFELHHKLFAEECAGAYGTFCTKNAGLQNAAGSGVFCINYNVLIDVTF
jgi:hypothetical protein